jgi:hypothetical protein
MADSIQPIVWPQVKIGEKVFTLRLSYAAYYQMAKWRTSTDSEMAAAAAGHFDAQGHWHSEGFENAMGIIDLISEQPAETHETLNAAISAALAEAVKKANLRPAALTPTETEKTEAA